MIKLINLLPWKPGYSGFSSYINRVLPSIEGLRIQVSNNGLVDLIDNNHWSVNPPPYAKKPLQKILQTSSLLQFGVNFSQLIQHKNLKVVDIISVYSPFLDFFWELRKKPQIITCPDLIQTRYKITNKSYIRAKIFYPLYINSANQIITYSRFVADQLIDKGIPSSKLEIVPCGIPVVRSRVQKPESCDLIVIARHDKHKNLEQLVLSLIYFYENFNFGGVIRIIGKFGPVTSKLKKIIFHNQFTSKILLIESVDSSQLLGYIRKSFALIAPSLEEGFDYPVLEAKAEGIPTILSDIKVHKEFHGKSSLFFDLRDAHKGLSLALNRLLLDEELWNELSLKGYTLAKSMSVEKQVSLTKEVIEQLI